MVMGRSSLLTNYTNYPDDMQFRALSGIPSRVVSYRSSFAAVSMGQIGYTLPDEGRIRWYGYSEPIVLPAA